MALTTAQKTHLQAKLEVRRNELLAEQKHLVGMGLLELSEENTGEISHVRTHPADLGSLEYDHELNVGLANQEGAELQDVEAALYRVQLPTYGICQRCRRDIALPRLEAIPQVRYCVACERKLETLAHG